MKILPNAAALKRDLADPELVCRALGLAQGAVPQSLGLLVRCPWHPDRTPSCSVTIAADGTLRVFCFACGDGGDVFSLIAKVHGFDVKREFPKVLAVAAGLIPDVVAGTGSTASGGHPPPLDAATFDTLVRSILAGSKLTSSSRAGAYLARRRLLSPAIADGWGALPDGELALGQLLAGVVDSSGPDAWRRSGLFTEAGALKFRTNVLLIPWHDENGLITTLQRRSLDGEHARYKYVFPDRRSPSTPYGVDALVARPRDEIVFVEGAVDVLAYRTLGCGAGTHRVVLGLPGVAAWRSSWAAYGKDRVVHVALDADAAGDRAAERVARDLHHAGATRVLRRRPNGANDWADLLAGRSS